MTNNALPILAATLIAALAGPRGSSSQTAPPLAPSRPPSSSTSSSTSSSSSSVPICCMPDRWQGKQVHSYLNIRRGQIDYGEVVAHVSYDAVNEREAYVTTRSDNLGPQQHDVFYLLYQENMMYVYNNQTGACIRQLLNKPFYKRCLPASTTLVDSDVRYGTGAETNVTALRVKFHYPQRYGNYLFITLTITTECIPLVEKFTVYPWGAGGMDTETVEFTDLKVGMVPDSLFDLPKACCRARFARPERYPSITFDF